jgi:FkbM family methyltransferase
MRIAFMTTMNRNVGDEFIREGIRSFFDDVLGSYDPFYVDKHDLTTLSHRVLDETETVSDKFRDADVIVQAGAPVYWNNNAGKHTSYNAEWSQPLWMDRIFRLSRDKRIFNLGAGSGQKGEDDLAALLSDPRLVDFARAAGKACAWTSVRDPLASQFLQQVGVGHELLPCPAFHAARRFKSTGRLDVLAVNLMPRAGHYRLKSETDENQWRGVIDELLPKLRSQHRLMFVAHDRAEYDFQRQLARGGEPIFIAGDYREYIQLYGQVEGIIANRVHGAVCVAGFGRPAVIIGNDSRIGIARPIGIPACDSAQATADWILCALQQQFDRGIELYDQRIELRESSARTYASRLAEHLRIAQDDNAFRFIMHDCLKPYENVLLHRRSTEGQNRALKVLIKPTDVVFDVGAHVGRFSVFVSRLPDFDGQIYAFEPVPQSYATLRENLRLNRTRRVTTIQTAIGSQTQPVMMNLFPTEFSSWNSMGRPQMTAPGGRRILPAQTVQVPGTTIDDFCTRCHIDRVDFLKVDVEGFEKAVFEGARRMLMQRRIERICFEISRDPLAGAGFTAREVFAALEACGYTVYRFDETENRFVGPVHDSAEHWANYFASYRPLPNSILTAELRPAA